MYSKNSRYTDTDLLTEDGIGFFDIWERITEIITAAESVNFLEHLVTQAEVGCLDLISDMYYDNERLWWFIAAFNQIIDPVGDMYVGQVLRIPPLIYLQSFLARSQHG